MNDPAAPAAVLFDLDGTLLDTAPDMVDALQLLLVEESRPPVEFASARRWVSNGVSGMLKVGFGDMSEVDRARRAERFLSIYASQLTAGTRLFVGMAEVLDALETAAIPWGVVTNKAAYLTEPILESLELRGRCACVVSGDTIGARKPSPEPLLHALAQIPAPAAGAWYVGDAARDITAGRDAGMRTIAALWGYIPPHDDPAQWGADLHAGHPSDLLVLLAARSA